MSAGLGVHAAPGATPDAGGDPRRANPNFALAAALFEGLAAGGVAHVCLSPGSRSAPLAVAAARTPHLRCWSHVDERASAFFALGLAKTLRAPVALLCTSGTAAANFHPAVAEAHHARVPLVVLTADRPPELRDWGAPQTIDQIGLFGRHARWFAEVATPDAGAVPPRYARSLAARAIAEATTRPRGPVHLNLPFREPLHPMAQRATGPEAEGSGATAARLDVTGPAELPSAAQVTALCELAAECSRGVIVCGPADGPPTLAAAVTDLGRAAGWPVLAESTSQLRRGPHVDRGPVLAHAELLIDNTRFAARHAPELVLQIGSTPTSKAYRRWLETHRPRELVLIDPDVRWSDPSHLATRALQADPAALCAAAVRDLETRPRRRSPGAWLRAFVESDRLAGEALAHTVKDASGLYEPRIVREIAAALPEPAILYTSNSMPVRELDAFLPLARRGLRILSNRGANGIDGMVSSALGAAAAGAAPVMLLTGDLAFLHDLGGLAALRRHRLRAIVVVLNNDGGGIFSRLPIAAWGESVAFEEHFRTPHGLDLSLAAALFGASFARATRVDALRGAVADALAHDGASVIEVPLDPDASLGHRRAIDSAVDRALAGRGGAP
jgi:2-succinyl-5-enolpyruvyl-6-hydroxy-3-cyclohexene-1-carboxylate synthase